MENVMLLGILVFPLIGVFSLMFLGIFNSGAFGRTGKLICILASTLSSVFALLTYFQLQGLTKVAHFFQVDWIRDFSIQFSLKMDGLSAVFCLLTAFVFPVLVGAQWYRSQTSGPMALILILQTSLVGTLLSEDLFFKCFFWFISAFPLYFLASLYGKEGVRKAAFSALMFANVGNILFFIGVMLIYQGPAQSMFSIDALSGLPPGSLENVAFSVFGFEIQLGYVLVALFSLALMCRTPIWPVSGWYLELIRSAPMSVLIGLVGAVFPTAMYLFVRLFYSLVPSAFEKAATIFAVIGAINLVVGVLGALQAKAVRTVIAYSAVSVFGFALIGLSVPKGEALIGVVIQSLAAGGALVLLGLMSDCLAVRNGSDDFGSESGEGRGANHGGLAVAAPWLAVFTALSFLACLAVPGTIGFVGNSLLIMGSYSERPWATFLMAGWFIIFASVFFKIFRELFLGENARSSSESDLKLSERILYVPLVVMVFWIGLYPSPTVGLLKGSIDMLLKRAQ